ncbi:Metallophosphoesterase [Cordyceps fumosorosea ARSEF 2679]|uniref:Metallophosphoesterase n=1 Tax=Cordyceps fumosorosea (strain ARSEF 2679) TaxID=1081104 RepID=A0A167R6B0_CORFA|nr:Metallophosphoesterase [Cordyceps fumosorosea ARSEF 2679]OAA58310.1 Metallophosphoesterase [Cordyceps fumosorosea ARSEF 2679]
MALEGRIPPKHVDVCIHAGDLTEESKLEEFRTTIVLLRRINAPLKLVIAGNHDFTLDTPIFRKKLQAIKPPLEPKLVKKVYGEFEEASQLLLDDKKHGIHLLNEGTHDFTLQNGGRLRVYASPYTPSLGDWGFQYHPSQGRDFAIEDGTDVVVTHGPPRGVLDRTDSRERAGCPFLFAAVARVRPQIHGFGHIHEGWGAKMVA